MPPKRKLGPTVKVKPGKKIKTSTSASSPGTKITEETDQNKIKIEEVNLTKHTLSPPKQLRKTNKQKTKVEVKREVKEEVKATASKETTESKVKQNNKLAKKKEVANKKSVQSNVDGDKIKVVAVQEVDSAVSIHKTGEMYVGAHVSAAGGVHKAVTNAKAIGCKAFALFLKSQRQWQGKPLSEEQITMFKDACKEHGYPPHLILPHGSYLINCAAPNAETFAKSRQALIDELNRCEQLGLTRYNFHPGSTCGLISVEEGIEKIASCINNALSKSTGVAAVLENMCGQGHTIGGKFKELRDIIDKVEDKTRVGVCLDTCHTFAAGFDLTTDEGYEDTLTKFDEIVGLKYLMGIHLNDSKGELGCHLDRHELIGKGKLKKHTFSRVMNDKRLTDIPLILETPGGDDVWAKEIKLLYSLKA